MCCCGSKSCRGFLDALEEDVCLDVGGESDTGDNDEVVDDHSSNSDYVNSPDME